MENRFRNYTFLFGFILSFAMANGQGNPGFLGKKIAISYGNQFCMLRSLDFFESDINMYRGVMNHDFYVEYATKKHTSIAAHISYQKVPVKEYGVSSAYLHENYTYTGQSFEALFEKSGGISDFSMTGIGLRLNFYYRNKSISAPIGVCSYGRVDVYSTKAINNNYRYYLANSDELTTYQANYAMANIDRTPENTQKMSLSLGCGLETKMIISRSMFFRLNGEFNLSTSLLSLGGSSDYYSSSYNTMEEDLKETSNDLTALRNMFLLGFGIGVLL